MKRNELRVGEEYAYSTTGKEHYGTMKHDLPIRVRIVDMGMFKFKRSIWGAGLRKEFTIRDTVVEVWDIVDAIDGKPNAVVAEILKRDGTGKLTPELRCLPHGHLKATWKEAEEILVANTTKREEENEQRNTTAKMNQDKFTEATLTIGATGVRLVGDYTDNPRVEMSLADFLAIKDGYVEALHAIEWEPGDE